MRISSILKEFYQLKMKYENQGIELPESVKVEYETRIFIEEVWRTLNSFVQGNAIPKAGWKWLDSICKKEIDTDISENIKLNLEACIMEMNSLRKILFEEENLLVDGYTLTKKGKKIIRHSCENIGKLVK